MDTYEATKAVLQRIQTLDPDNASKIMGYILIQDQGEKEILRLAFGPESHLISYMNQAKACLGLGSSSPSSTPFPQASPRVLIPNNGFHHLGGNSNPSSPGFQRSSPRPISYAAVLNGSNPVGNNGSGSSSLNLYGGNEFGDEFMLDPIMSPSGRSDSLVFPYSEDIPSPHPFHHRRSCSVNDAAFLSNLEEMSAGAGGFGWRPCMYFARGFCKNGSSCKFLHSDSIGPGDGIEFGGSPGKVGSGFEELLRMKALQQQRFALMASGGHHPFAYSKCMNFLNENPRNDFSALGLGGSGSSSSRQIYLTFPADSTFREEDVSGYFSLFGPVQDVRIPYQQKRMFGFVTFVYPETVKLILAKGNPHFVCDSRVLVKPYKEKGKVADKKQHQMESGDYPGCLSPSGMDSRDHFDMPFGSRMLLNTQEMIIRRKIEQEAELQHALELEGRRMMNMKLMDLKNQHRNHHYLQNVPSGPRTSQFMMNQGLMSSDFTTRDFSEEFDLCKEDADAGEKLVAEAIESSALNNNTNGTTKQQPENAELPESMEHVLPDNLFASPTKLATERQSVYSQAFGSNESSITNSSANKAPVGPPLSMASLRSNLFQMPSH